MNVEGFARFDINRYAAAVIVNQLLIPAVIITFYNKSF